MKYKSLKRIIFFIIFFLPINSLNASAGSIKTIVSKESSEITISIDNNGDGTPDETKNPAADGNFAPIEDCNLNISPSVVNSGVLLPRFRIITITGNNTNFNKTSQITIEEIRRIIPLSIINNRIKVFIVVPSKSRLKTGTKEITVMTGNEVCKGNVTILRPDSTTSVLTTTTVQPATTTTSVQPPTTTTSMQTSTTTTSVKPSTTTTLIDLTVTLSNLAIQGKMLQKISGNNVGSSDFVGKVLYGDKFYLMGHDVLTINDDYISTRLQQTFVAHTLNTISLPITVDSTMSTALNLYDGKLGDLVKGYLNNDDADYPYTITAEKYAYLDRMWFYNSGISTLNRIYMYGTNVHTIGGTYKSATLLYYWDIAGATLKAAMDDTDLADFDAIPKTLPLLHYSENVFPYFSSGTANGSAYYDYLAFFHNGNTKTYNLLADNYAYFLAVPLNDKPPRIYIGRVPYNDASIIDPDAYTYWDGSSWNARQNAADEKLNIGKALNVLQAHADFLPLLVYPSYNQHTGHYVLFISTISRETALWGGPVHIYQSTSIAGPYSYTGVSIQEDLDADHKILEYLVPLQWNDGTFDCILQYYDADVPNAVTNGYGGYKATMTWSLQ
jgi:hypothetical protein